MKKLFIALSMLAMGVVSTSAQVAYEKSKLLDNVYVGVEGGVVTPMTFKTIFPLNPAAGLKFGKWFNPMFGANLEALAFFGNNGFYTGAPGSGIGMLDSHTVVRGLNVGLNGNVNFTNIFCEYNPDRAFELIGEAGIGYTIFYGDNRAVSPDNTLDDTELTSKTGLQFAFNFGDEKQFQFYVEPAVLWNLTHGPGDAVQFNKHAAQLGLFFGVNYKFMTSNGTHNFKVYDVAAMNKEINSLRDQLAAKPKEVIKEVVKEIPVEAQKELCVEDLIFVTFAQGKHYLTNDAKAALDKVPEGRHVQIVGTASPEGPKELNDRLSQARADEVAKYLQNKGVVIDSATGKGVQGVTSNRLAVIYVK